MKKLLSIILCISLASAGMGGLTAGFTAKAQSSGMVNLMNGGYGWIYSSSWGTPKNAIDGNMNTQWSLGNHSQQVAGITAGFKIGGDELKKYNRVVLYFYAPQKMVSYKVAGYESVETDPGASSTSTGFKGVSGEVSVAVYNHQDVSTIPDTAYSNRVIVQMPESAKSKYFGITLFNGPDKTDNSCGVSEFEVYYVTPRDVKLADSNAVLYVPAEAGTMSLNIPEMKLYDEAGGELVTQFDHSVSLAGDYPGVTLQDGKINISYGCDADAIDLLYKAWDEDGVLLEKTVSVPLEVCPREYREVLEAAGNLDFSLMSQQKISAVGDNLSLPQAGNGILQIGSKSYTGMDIAWSSSNTGIITDTGVVQRPSNQNTVVTLTAKLSKRAPSGELFTAEKKFDITVIKAGVLIDMVNLMKGGYGWATSGWGTPTLAVDGDMSTKWALGNHSHGSTNGGFKIAGDKPQKYNKAVIYFFAPDKMASYSVKGYESVSNDPGGSASVGFTGGSGPVSVVSYDVQKPSTVPDADGKVTVKMPESATSQYFGVTIENGLNTSDNSCGIFEFEVYYATPHDVRLADANTVLYVPARAGTASFDIPALNVYDEMGDALAAQFEHSVSLAGNYPGVTLQNGKINVSYGCSADAVDLLYKSWDEDRVWLEKTVRIPLKPYTQDYYDAVEVGEYLNGLIPGQVETDLAFPAEYNGAAITWTSDNENYISPTGTVHRPAYAAKDENVTLTAVITKGEYSITKSFPALVIREMTDAQRALQDADRIETGISGTVSGDITLPAEGYYGSRITWSSNRPEIISGSGVYHRVSSSKEREAVTLTAMVAYNGTDVEKDFILYAQTDLKSSGGGGGSSSGKGSSISLGNSGSVVMPPLTDDEIVRGKFEDVPSTHWAKTCIENLAAKRIVSGIDNTHFDPDRAVTREEFTKMVITAFGFTLKPGETKFADVESGAWYGDYVASAYKEGLVNGIGESEFGIGKNITREDMAVIIEKVLALRKVDFVGNSKSFADAGNISEYAVSAVNNLATISVLSGDGAGNFMPGKNATRAEAAQVLLTAMEKGGIK